MIAGCIFFESFEEDSIIHRPREAAEGLVVVEIIVGVTKRVD